MKKVFKFAALAVVVMSLAVACKSNNTEAVEEDSTNIEMVVEDTVDTVEAVAEVAEAVVNEPAKKPATKKEDVQSTNAAPKVTPKTVETNSTKEAAGARLSNTGKKADVKVEEKTVQENNASDPSKRLKR